MKTNNIIALIPARGGSKKLPKKNVKMMLGKPLISHTILYSLKSKYIGRTIVTTDDNKIAEISKKYGAEIIKRPKSIAGDNTKMIEVVFHALKTINPDIIVLLQPTSPLRTTKDIDKAIGIFLKNNCEMVMSVGEIKASAYWALVLKGKYLEKVFKNRSLSERHQDLPNIYIPNGAIYITTPAVLRKYKMFHPNKIMPYFMPRERSIDIDDEFDFLAAEKMMKKYA